MYLVHSNHITILALSPRHEIIKNQDKIIKVNYDVNKKGNRTQMVVTGKKKNNATEVVDKTVVCELETESGQVYRIRSFIGKARLIEINEAAIE